MQFLLKRFSLKQQRKMARHGIVGVAHLWDGSDTLCRMWSTDGILSKKIFEVTSDSEGRPICKMCQTPRLDQQFREAIEADGSSLRGKTPPCGGNS